MFFELRFAFFELRFAFFARRRLDFFLCDFDVEVFWAEESFLKEFVRRRRKKETSSKLLASFPKARASVY